MSDQNADKDIIAIDCYCGAGGLTRGLREAGIAVVKGIDNDATSRDTYEKNNPGAAFMEADMRKVTPEQVMQGIQRDGKRLLLAGCAPCQPFSRQNAMGTDRHKRRSLISHFGMLVSRIKPEFVLIENVPGFRDESNSYHKDFTEMLKTLEYSFDEGVLNAVDYGIPQSRRRYVMLASKNGTIRLPKKTHGPTLRRYRTVKDTISRLPELAAGEISTRIKNHTSSRLHPINLERIKRIQHDGDGREKFPHSLTLSCHVGHSGHTDVYGRMAWDKPAPTMTCRCTSLSNGRFGHPEQNRALSVREAALLQTFPRKYVFYATHTHNTRHVGNAVPVRFAKKLGRVIMNS